MWGAIKYNLSHLGDFKGRDARQTFWYYVLFLVILNVAVSMAISIPMTIQAMTEGFNAASNSNPEIIEAAMVDRMAGMADTLLWVSLVSAIVNIILIAASLVRRLHDAGWSGYWVILPLVFQIWSIWTSVGQIGRMEEMMRRAMETRTPDQMLAMQGEYAAQGLVAWIPLVIVIVFGVLKSQDGPNQYGDAPVRF